jgi:hypothetical protein
MTLRKNDRVARNKPYGRLIANLDETLAFGDQMEDHDTLRAGFKERRSRVCARGLVAPRRRKPRIDEDRADQAHSTQCFRERIHY